MERYGLREALMAVDDDIIQDSESDDDYRSGSPTIEIQQAIIAQPLALFNSIHSDEEYSDISAQENVDDDDSESEQIVTIPPMFEIQEAVVAQPIVLLNDIQSVELGSEISVQEIPNDNDDIISVVSSSSALISDSNSASRESTSETDVKLENTETVPIEVLSKKRARSESDNEEDGQLCPICLDNWTNSGEHRICSLKCGHLFGHSCIIRWLQMQTKRSCPTCKKKVMKTDIRFIYAKKLIAVDTSELDEIKQKLDNMIDEKNKMQLELSKFICREHSLNQEIAKLKTQLNTFKNNPLLFSVSSAKMDNSHIKVKLYMDKSLDICHLGGCRVFDTSPNLDLIMANVKSPNPLFPGFGLRKISISQYKPLAFLPLHSGQIRDISFQNSKVLTVSMDKSFKITDSISNSNICSLHQTMPLWSCCWDTLNNNYFYIGTQMGSVFKYDQRNLGGSLSIYTVPGDMSPVVSVAHIPNEPGLLPRDGVVSCKLNSLWFFENISEYISHPLSIDGPFYSMKFDTTSKQLLVSSRPNSRNPNSRHTLAIFKAQEGKVDVNCLHIFESAGLQKHLSRSCFIQGENEYVAAHEESSKMVNLWNINNGMKVTSVAAHEPVLDLNAVSQNGNKFLIGLTEKKMQFYKFV
ncbi:hypothetical protein WA026_020937 [Henosepilachna vigintioctopunctata]|uniref:RING-type E3 ubiquitin transferase n=1 Tax=Henosepilachna vigintioctopunctata TaxID=420089 RepID=A0AAW1UFG9_9CUCU